MPAIVSDPRRGVVSKIVKLDLGDKRGSIWIEAEEVGAESSGRESVGRVSDAVAALAPVFEQFARILEVAEAQLSKLARTSQETSLEINAKLSTEGNLIIVQGSAEASIKVTMKWSAPKDAHA
jgi:hypothetical protein